jgi:hypothetical protein
VGVWSTPQKRVYSCSRPGVSRWSIAVCEIIIATGNPWSKYANLTQMSKILSAQDIFQKTRKSLHKAGFLSSFFLSRLRIRYLWAVQNPASSRLIFKAPVKQKQKRELPTLQEVRATGTASSSFSCSGSTFKDNGPFNSILIKDYMR